MILANSFLVSGERSACTFFEYASNISALSPKELGFNKIREWLGDDKHRPYKKTLSCRGEPCVRPVLGLAREMSGAQHQFTPLT